MTAVSIRAADTGKSQAGRNALDHARDVLEEIFLN